MKKLVVVGLFLFSVSGASAHDNCGNGFTAGVSMLKPTPREVRYERLRYASEMAAQHADEVARSSADSFEHAILLRAYRYWSDMEEHLLEKEIDKDWEE
jgi:hypothetical protein